MPLPSERIQQPNLMGMFMLAQQLRAQKQQEQMHDFQLSRMMESDQRANSFRGALTSGDMTAARNADPMAFMGLQAKQIEAAKAGLDIDKDKSKLLDDQTMRTEKAQRAIYSELETNNTPEGLRAARAKRDALVGTRQFDHFNLPGEDTANDNGVETWVQAEPTKSEIVTAQAGAGVDTLAKQRAINEQTTGLRDKFEALPETKSWKVVKQGVDNILSAASDGPGDLARIYSLVKILDTSSAVKDGEIGLASGAGGYLEQLKSLISRAKGDGILSGPLRQQFEDTARRLAATYKANYDAQATNYAGLAKGYGLDSGQVVLPMAAEAQTPAAPQASQPNAKGPREITYTVPPPITPNEADALADKYGFK